MDLYCRQGKGRKRFLYQSGLDVQNKGDGIPISSYLKYCCSNSYFKELKYTEMDKFYKMLLEAFANKLFNASCFEI